MQKNSNDFAVVCSRIYIFRSRDYVFKSDYVMTGAMSMEIGPVDLRLFKQVM